jgi:maleate isomerase
MDGMASPCPDLTDRRPSGAVAPGDLGVGVGVVVPYDFVLDRELWRWTPDDVNLHLTRTPFEDVEVSVAQALAVGDRATVARATREVMTAEPAVVAYGCTSGSFVGGRSGEAALAGAMVDAGAPRAVTTSGALLQALKSLGLHSLAVVTPYDDQVGQRLEDFLAESDVKVVATGNMGLTGRIWTVPYEATIDLVRRTVRPDADGVFISCTNLRTFDAIAPLERELGMPVLTANQVTMWVAVAAAGSRARGEAQRLLTTLPT